ncbi:unnamed protein product [Cuscuta epithymum]|uniref:Uncharacterized protein n=1 Tax=Cuscuta epithymum TaxID=186058 RepID=A0AAV0ETU1_9ASTE|nr:unnamed protein product [Cuscuta epithymum]
MEKNSAKHILSFVLCLILLGFSHPGLHVSAQKCDSDQECARQLVCIDGKPMCKLDAGKCICVTGDQKQTFKQQNLNTNN